MPRWAIIAAPHDKRAVGFQAALSRCGERPPLMITWPEVAADPSRALATLAADDILRIDSPGADERAWTSLAACGDGRLLDGFRDGRWQPGAHRHAGLARVLGAIETVIAQRGLRVLTPPRDILAMGDKLRCRELLAAAGIRMPEALPANGSYDAMVAAMAARGWNQIFIKPRWGSSGAGIIAYRRSHAAQRVREMAITALSPITTPDGLRFFNSKRLRAIDDPAVIRALVGTVLADGAVVERWIPKLAVAGGPVDLRMVAIGGRLRHRIARVGSGPITNLHLDARRLDADQLLAQADPRRRTTILDTATAVARAFPRSWYLGVDLLLTQGFRDCLVCEINAWGDLLPGLVHDGEDTFTAEIRSFLAQPQGAASCKA